MKIKEIPILIMYSIKGLLVDFGELIMELKSPKTWSYIIYAVVLYGVFSNNANLLKISVPVLFVIYLIRQKIDGSYRHDKFVRDIKNDKDSELLLEYYNSYVKKCHIKDIEPELYTDWKKDELKKINRKRI